MSWKETFGGAGAIFALAVLIGAFIGIVRDVINGGGWFYILLSAACFAAAWIVGKIADRKNKGDE